MLSHGIINALNQQLNREYQSAFKYTGMAIYCLNQGLTGCASWLQHQATEERAHGNKIITYLNDLEAIVELGPLEKPKQDYQDIKEVFEAALLAEESITQHLSELTKLAREEQDQLTINFLQWFLQEQVEEIASANQILEDIKLLGTEGMGLYMLDEKLGKRNETE